MPPGRLHAMTHVSSVSGPDSNPHPPPCFYPWTSPLFLRRLSLSGFVFTIPLDAFAVRIYLHIMISFMKPKVVSDSMQKKKKKKKELQEKVGERLKGFKEARDIWWWMP